MDIMFKNGSPVQSGSNCGYIALYIILALYNPLYLPFPKNDF